MLRLSKLLFSVYSGVRINRKSKQERERALAREASGVCGAAGERRMILIDVEEGHPSLHAQLTSSRVIVPGYRFFLTVENRQESPNIPVETAGRNSSTGKAHYS